MPWRVEKNEGCSESRPWGVVREEDGLVEGCHPTEADAQEQMRALYAAEATKMLRGVRHVETSSLSALRWGARGELHEYRDAAGFDRALKRAVSAGLAAGEVEDMSDLERDVARDLCGRAGVRKEEGGSAYLAWWLGPEDATRVRALAPGGVVPEDSLHVTLLYLGDPGRDYGGGRLDLDLVAAVTKILASRTCRFSAVVTGLARFVGEGDEDAVVALVDSEPLEALRARLKEELCYASALPWGSPVFEPRHGFIPHITLDYVGRGAPSPPPMTELLEVEVESVAVSYGEGRVVFPLHKEGYEAPQPMPEDRSVRRSRQPEPASQGSPEGEGDLVYVIEKAAEERRYTLGPLYVPDRKDAHGEWTDAQTLQDAVHGFVEESAGKGRALRLQHDTVGEGGQVAGHWVEVVSWPYEHSIKVSVPGGEERELTMPAGTVYMGVRWTEEYWPAVKAGKIAGLSLGGKAVRVRTPDVELDHMGDKHPATGTEG